MDLLTLKPNKRNPRSISASALQAIKESIKRDPQFMAIRPIIVDKEKNILGGNQRYTALLQLGYSEVPDEWVLIADDLNEEQKKRFVVIDNGPAQGSWDENILCNDFDVSELKSMGFDFLDKLDIDPDSGHLEEITEELKPMKTQYVLLCVEADAAIDVLPKIRELVEGNGLEVYYSGN